MNAITQQIVGARHASPLLQTVPDTVNFLILGYVVIGTVGLIYIISLVVRQRNLRRDIEVMDAITREDENET